MLIGLCSPAMGSGKSTVADYLVRHHGFSRVALATPLKMMTTALLSACVVMKSTAGSTVT